MTIFLLIVAKWYLLAVLAFYIVYTLVGGDKIMEGLRKNPLRKFKI